MIPLVSFLLLGGSYDLLATRSAFFFFHFSSGEKNAEFCK
jgi:hypothetical protein